MSLARLAVVCLLLALHCYGVFSQEQMVNFNFAGLIPERNCSGGQIESPEINLEFNEEYYGEGDDSYYPSHEYNESGDIYTFSYVIQSLDGEALGVSTGLCQLLFLDSNLDSISLCNWAVTFSSGDSIHLQQIGNLGAVAVVIGGTGKFFGVRGACSYTDEGNYGLYDCNLLVDSE